MYCPKLVKHSNQIKLPMASGVDYIISRMSQPFSKVLSLCTGTQNVKIFIWNSSVEFISHHLPWKRKSTYKLQKSIPLRYVNIFMTESIRPLWEVMLMFFQFLKSSGYMCNLCSQNETSITKFGQQLIFRMNISGLLYASYLVLLMNRINIENYRMVIRY